ncbi:molybdopterin-dependent oxidoreductase [Clostridia bacterium]|nr:molybdopterin-dependent oxidoreductase [Clostridia bacterium]
MAVNERIDKQDGLRIVTGSPIYTDDIASPDALVVKIMHSEHHYARIKKIDTQEALKMPGVACILTYKDIAAKPITRAGQTYPEPSPQDWKILDEYVRFKGDDVAIVAADTQRHAVEAMAKIEVEYEVLEPVLDFMEAEGNKAVVHQEEDCFAHFDFGFRPKENVAGSLKVNIGDYEKGLKESDVVITREYRTQATHPAMMEPLTAYTYLDHVGRLVVVASTQVPFHVRRQVATALNIPMHKVRVIKPRIGGGFGCKQTSGAEFYPSLVTLKTGRPAKIYFSRNEVFLAATRRHPFWFELTVGATKDGIIKCFDMKARSDAGAYGEHCWTVLEAGAEKCMALYNKVEGYRYDGKALYTNRVSSGAFRGYGKTQNTFAVECIVNELAEILNIDPVELRNRNIIREGEVLRIGHDHIYDAAVMRQDSCKLDYCLKRGAEMSNWKNSESGKTSSNKAEGTGLALSIQGSGIINLDSGGATLKLNSDGFFTLLIGSADMGTGCDTILAQMAADALEVPYESIVVNSADTDVSPYDDGSYASSTTYVTGTAVVKAAADMIKRLKEEVAKLWKLDLEEISYREGVFTGADNEIDLNHLSYELNSEQISVTRSHKCAKEAPPYKSGFAKVEVDLETGKIKVNEFNAVVDCGTPINPNLATVQTQGGVLQGIGMALFEEINYSQSGDELNDSFMTYKLPCKKEAPKINVEFADSYEPSGPFGAKSIGEVVINAAAPAVIHAIYKATGIWFRELPVTPEKMFKALKLKSNQE